MKLKDLLEKISPLPWSAKSEGITNLIRDSKTSCVAMEATDCGDPISPEDAAYIVHAANVLPELIEAVRRQCDDIARPELIEALRRVDEVKMENDEPSESARTK